METRTLSFVLEVGSDDESNVLDASSAIPIETVDSNYVLIRRDLLNPPVLSEVTRPLNDILPVLVGHPDAVNPVFM